MEELNHFNAQPQDWAKLMLYHVSPTIKQALRLEVPRPHNVTAVVQYLRRAYPVRGAMSSLRTRMFRKLEQGTGTVTEFYNKLLSFARENPTIYTPRELRLQFIENLSAPISERMLTMYDADYDTMKLTELFQRAVVVEMRLHQDVGQPPTQKQKSGGSYWYGKQKAHHEQRGGENSVTVAAAMTGKGGQTSNNNNKRACYNCGKLGHFSRDCRGPRRPCDNCGQQGHHPGQCKKPCPNCGEGLHRHATCGQKAVAAAMEGSTAETAPVRGSLPLFMYVLAGVTPSETCNTVLTAPLHIQGIVTHVVTGLDTMAAVNVISEETVATMTPVPSRLTSPVVLRGLHGPTASRGKVNVKVSVPGFPAEDTSFEVVAELPCPIQAILGHGWLSDHAVCISLNRQQRRVEWNVPTSTPTSTAVMTSDATVRPSEC